MPKKTDGVAQVSTRWGLAATNAKPVCPEPLPVMRERLFAEAKSGKHDAWHKLVELAKGDLVFWLRRRFHPKLRTWEIEDICEHALVKMGLRFPTITSWPQAWVYSRTVAVSLLRNRTRKRRTAFPLAETTAFPLNETADPSPIFTDKAEFLDLLGAIAARLTLPQCDVLFALCRAVLNDETRCQTAAKLRMSLRSFERAKHEVLALVRAWFPDHETVRKPGKP